MKRADREIEKVYNQYDIELPQTDDAQVKALLQRVMEKAERNTPIEEEQTEKNTIKLSMKKRMLMGIAAVIAVILMAAGVVEIADIFREHLKELDKEGEIVALSGMDGVVNQTGAVSGQRVVQGDVAVTLQGIISDGKNAKIMLDVENIKGKSLEATPETEEERNNGVMVFETMWIKREGYADGGKHWLGSKTETISYSESHKRIIIEMEMRGSGLSKEGTYSLTVENLYNSLYREYALEMKPDRLYEAVTAFPPPSESAFREEDFRDKSGEKQYVLTQISTIREELVTGVELYNAAIKDGILYLSGKKDAALAYEGNLLKLRKIETGKEYKVSGGITSYVMNGDADFNLRISGIETAEDLRGIEMICSKYREKVQEGKWEFNIELPEQTYNYEAYLNDAVEINGLDFTVRKIKISPYMVQVLLLGEEETIEALQDYKGEKGEFATPQWLEKEHTIRITLRDGNVLEVKRVGVEFKEKEGVILKYPLPVVINPEQIESIAIDKVTVEKENFEKAKA